MDSYTSNTTDDIYSDGIDHELSYDDIRDAIVHVVAFLLLVVLVLFFVGGACLEAMGFTPHVVASSTSSRGNGSREVIDLT